MAKTSDKAAGLPKADKTGALPGSGLLAEENEFDRKSLLRIGTWGVLALGAVALAVVSNQSVLGLHREVVAASDLARQAQQIRELTKESQNETRRLASAIDTLNNDRDRLYSRVTVLEQGLDSVTGAIAKQNTPPPAAAASAPAPVAAAEPSPAPSPTANLGAIPQAKAQVAPPLQPMAPPQSQTPPPPSVAPVASAPPTPAPALGPQAPDKPRADAAAKPEQTPSATSTPAPAQFASTASALAAGSSPPLIVPKSMMGPPDPAAPKLIEAPKAVAGPLAPAPPPAAQAAPQATAATAPANDQDTAQASEVTVHHTEFAVDVGSANSVAGLRALWRGLLKSNAELAELRPIIVVKESTTGYGMQLRLAAGPLHDAAAAAKICAALMENKRACETTVFDGQRLAMAADEMPGDKGGEVKPAPGAYRHSYYPKRAKKDDTPAKSEPSTLSSLFGVGKK